MERDTMPSYYSWDGKDNGWDKLAELDLSPPDYSFDLLVVWRNRETGQVVYATDSGCSCPSPFEDHGPDDFKEFSWTAIEAILRNEDDGYHSPSPTDVATFKDELRKAGVS